MYVVFLPHEGAVSTVYILVGTEVCGTGSRSSERKELAVCSRVTRVSGMGGTRSNVKGWPSATGLLAGPSLRSETN